MQEGKTHKVQSQNLPTCINPCHEILYLLPQETAALLWSVCPLVVFSATDIIRQMLVFPASSPGGCPMVNGPVCKKLFLDSVFMGELVRFAIVHATLGVGPRSDLQWMAYGVAEFFQLVQKAGNAFLALAPHLEGTEK